MVESRIKWRREVIRVAPLVLYWNFAREPRILYLTDSCNFPFPFYSCPHYKEYTWCSLRIILWPYIYSCRRCMNKYLSDNNQLNKKKLYHANYLSIYVLLVVIITILVALIVVKLLVGWSGCCGMVHRPVSHHIKKTKTNIYNIKSSIAPHEAYIKKWIIPKIKKLRLRTHQQLNCWYFLNDN